MNRSGRRGAVGGAGGGVSDHGALTGLTDNDHPQYELVDDLEDDVNAIIAGTDAFDPAGTAATAVEDHADDTADVHGAGVNERLLRYRTAAGTGSLIVLDQESFLSTGEGDGDIRLVAADGTAGAIGS